MIKPSTGSLAVKLMQMSLPLFLACAAILIHFLPSFWPAIVAKDAASVAPTTSPGAAAGSTHASLEPVVGDPSAATATKTAEQGTTATEAQAAKTTVQSATATKGQAADTHTTSTQADSSAGKTASGAADSGSKIQAVAV